MANYIKASLERSYAESFLTELERNENQYFFFIAKSTSWQNESSPPSYTDTIRSEYEVMNNIIGYKKITPENVFYALPRYEWTAGTTYAQYDDAVDLFDDVSSVPFYVVTDENKIYKCLGNGGGVPSTEKPTEVLSSAFALSDGYVWQYLATVRESDLPYELSDYLPIDYAYTAEDTETQNQYNAQIAAVSGAIDRISISGLGAVGASAGVYTYTRSGDSAIRLATIQTLSPTQKLVTITDSVSRDRIGSTPSNYVGYVLRISNSTVNAGTASEINNYGVITDAFSVPNAIQFTITNDAMDFTFTPPVAGNATSIVSAEILPFVKITGNGSGAYAFPTTSSSNTITSVVVASGGVNYSQAAAEVVTPKTANTVHPTIRTILAPKGGHASNILKELNVKDIIIVVQISESDAEKIRGGGNYRQFGIIKNPRLRENKLLLAGTEIPYYTDLFLVPENEYISSDFSSTGEIIVVGDESNIAAKVLNSGEVYLQDGSFVKIKTTNAIGRFISRLDRSNDFILTFAAGGKPSPFSLFRTNEKVIQRVPSGTIFNNNIVYGYDIVVEGTVLESGVDECLVRVTSGGNFVANTDAFLTGQDSGVTASIAVVSPRYGEYIRIFSISGENANVVSRDDISRLYKVVSVGLPYYEENAAPSYRGLNLLEISTSISGITGGLDLSTSPLSQTSFSNGDIVVQGSTGYGSNYAAGVVYEWDFVNPAYGRLYVTGVTGKFMSVETHGFTGTTLGPYVLAAYYPSEIDTTSGEILYIDNVRPITRVTGQKEEFRLRLGF